MKTKEVTVSTTKKQRINRSAEQWRELVWEQRRSSLSLEEFCRGVSASTTAFARWRKHFGDAPEPATRTKTRAVVLKRDAVRADETAPAFVELAAPLRALDAGVKVRLDLGGGIVLELVRA